MASAWARSRLGTRRRRASTFLAEFDFFVAVELCLQQLVCLLEGAKGVFAGFGFTSDAVSFAVGEGCAGGVGLGGGLGGDGLLEPFVGDTRQGFFFAGADLGEFLLVAEAVDQGLVFGQRGCGDLALDLRLAADGFGFGFEDCEAFLDALFFRLSFFGFWRGESFLVVAGWLNCFDGWRNAVLLKRSAAGFGY